VDLGFKSLSLSLSQKHGGGDSINDKLKSIYKKLLISINMDITFKHRVDET
jgi:hypothetical protein